MTPEALSRLERDEGGHKLRMYEDSMGIPTIGVGHNLRDRAISHRASQVIFEDDVTDVETEVARLAPWIMELDAVRRDTLLSIAYNMGVGGLLSRNPKMCEAIRRSAWAEAGQELLDGPYKRQVGARAFRYSQQLVTGQWAL